MNKQRRADIAQAISHLESAKEALDAARELLDNAATEEREYYDNMPESLQGGDKGTQADAAATVLEEARDKIDELDIESLVGELEGASE